LLRRGWHWLSLLGRVVGVTALAAAVTFVANTLLLNRLPVLAAGQYALLQSLVATLVAVGGLGQPALLLRLYGRAPGRYQWPTDFRRSLVWAGPLLALAIMAAWGYYELPLSHGLFLAGAAPLLLGSHLLSAIFAARRRHVWSNLLLRLPSSLMIAPALAIILVAPRQRLPAALVGYLVSLALVVAVSYLALSWGGKDGGERLGWRQRMQGLWLLASQASTIALDQGLLVIAGAMLPTERVAVQAAIVTLLSPLQLVWSVLTNILLGELAQRRTIRYGPMIAGVTALAISLVLAAAAIGPLALRLLFAGRYELGEGLVAAYAFIYLFKLAETFPRTHITSRASAKALSVYVSLQLFLALAGMAGTVILARRLGLAGVIAGGLALSGARATLSYLFLWRTVHFAPKPPSAA
jgi:hypothetical protein